MRVLVRRHLRHVVRQGSDLDGTRQFDFLMQALILQSLLMNVRRPKRNGSLSGQQPGQHPDPLARAGRRETAGGV